MICKNFTKIGAKTSIGRTMPVELNVHHCRSNTTFPVSTSITNTAYFGLYHSEQRQIFADKIKQMKDIVHKIKNIDWQQLTETMHQNGYAIIPGLLSEEDCEILKSNYDHSALYRKTVVMARHRFGLGEYRYFNYPLPEIIQIIRTTIYPYLA